MNTATCWRTVRTALETKIKPCPLCGEQPIMDVGFVGYNITCACWDPTPIHPWEPQLNPEYYGTGMTELDAIDSWNESVERGRNEKRKN